MSDDPTPSPTWEELYKEAEAACERAHKVINDLAGWSGSSGHWGLQECSVRIRQALESFRKPIDKL